MASLSEQMKNKRDVRRRSAVLIIDKDLGNYGLYKSILAMEYELECANSINLAMSLLRSRYFDVIIADGSFSPDVIGALYSEVCGLYEEEEPILLVLEEPHNKETIIDYLCEGARDYIVKPFSKEGITNILYEHLKKRRSRTVRQKVLIVDDDFKLLTEMKEYLEPMYDVNIINSREAAERFAERYTPDLVICDIAMFGDRVKSMCAAGGLGHKRIPILFMTDRADEETVRECASFEPEGFLVKPIESDMLIRTLERIFLMESYTNFGR